VFASINFRTNIFVRKAKRIRRGQLQNNQVRALRYTFCDIACRCHIRHSPRNGSGAMMIVRAGLTVDTGCPAILDELSAVAAVAARTRSLTFGTGGAALAHRIMWLAGSACCRGVAAARAAVEVGPVVAAVDDSGGSVEGIHDRFDEDQGVVRLE
jgi:hypothetical protein